MFPDMICPCDLQDIYKDMYSSVTYREFIHVSGHVLSLQSPEQLSHVFHIYIFNERIYR